MSRARSFAVVSMLFCAVWTGPARAAGPGHVLFLADSHALGPFGDAFERGLLRASGNEDAALEVETYAMGGSAPSWFYHGTVSACGYEGHASVDRPPPVDRRCHKTRTPLISDLLRLDETVVVALGTNLINDPLGWTYGHDSIVKMVRSIHAAGARCVWVGPPRMRRFDAKLDAFYGVIEKALADAGDCPLVDSRPFTRYPAAGGDGIHYSFPAGVPIAKAWGAAVAAKIKSLHASVTP